MATKEDESSTYEGPSGIPGSRELMSAWPPFVALGLVVAEVGIVLNLVPLSIGGILLFGGSVAGILQDAETIETPWYALAVVGVLFSLFGAGVWWTQLDSLALAHVLSVGATNPIAIRGEAILLAGVLLVVGAVAGTVYEPLRNSP
ncbi:MAG: DUF7541 family protein [Halanaeroarchaeum sp.]